MRHPLHLALAACLVSGVANAQIFNCGPAHFLDERAICQDQGLSGTKPSSSPLFTANATDPLFLVRHPVGCRSSGAFLVPTASRDHHAQRRSKAPTKSGGAEPRASPRSGMSMASTHLFTGASMVILLGRSLEGKPAVLGVLVGAVWSLMLLSLGRIGLYGAVARSSGAEKTVASSSRGA
jgi:hypothetical protein